MLKIAAHKKYPNRPSSFHLSVSSGKGGVGKTLTTVHLSILLQNLGRKVLVIDADMGLSNVDVILGLRPQGTLHEVLEGLVSMDEIILESESGIHIIPSGSGIAKMANLNHAQRMMLTDHFKEVIPRYDTVVIDTGAGISSNVLHFASLGERRIVVTTPEPHAITDAYALMKVMKENYGSNEFDLVVNQVRSLQEGSKIHLRLSEVASRFLGAKVNCAGIIPYDESVQQSVLSRSFASMDLTRSIGGQAWSQLANHIEKYRFNNEFTQAGDYFSPRLVELAT